MDIDIFMHKSARLLARFWRMQCSDEKHREKASAIFRQAVLLCLAACVLLAPVPGFAAREGRAPLAEATGITENFYADEGFASALPLLVLRLEAGTVAVEESDFLVETRLLSYEGAQSNALSDAPTVSAAASLRNMTGKSRAAGRYKDDYYLRLDEPAAVAGLESCGEYILLGGRHDKSLIRNYIGYTLAAGIVENAPAVQLCEVLLRGEGGDLYQGVYTLVRLSPDEDKALFHRSLGEDGIAVETSATRNDPDNGRMFLPFWEANDWNDRYSESIGALSYAEDVLYSTDSRTFYTTPNHFDIDAFANQFILGEIMQDYDGIYESYYYFDPNTKLVSPAPIWNFECAADNSPKTAARPEQLEYAEAPYFDQFFKSPNYASMIQERYLALRRTVINEENLQKLVETGAALVADATRRDWARWDDYSSYVLAPLTEIEEDDETVTEVLPYARQTGSYAEELMRLRYTLRTHDLHTGINITQFDFSEQEVQKEIALSSNPLWPILSLVVFFLLVRFVRRYGM
ncbi:CotH kinase family protein [Eubacteriales bacterium OttesenSCG-928-N13]|nr:CotH kinase family protein [Eubacteriales bacterium OttesenSCG-928-N13]